MAKDTFDTLRNVVGGVSGKPGWKFSLIDEDGALRLRIVDTKCVDAFNPGEPFPLAHYFPVPTATYNEASWRRWVFERCRDLETHELGEWVRWGDDRPFAPAHGPGENPYDVTTYRDPIVARTTQDGSIR